MPIPPRPMTARCPHCHWQRTFAPSSDAIFREEWMEICPRCATRDMKIERAQAMPALWARMKRMARSR